MRPFHRLHRFLVADSFYPLALSTLLAGAIFAGRVYLSHRFTFYFLVWNLFLAWIPYLCALAVISLYRSGSWRRVLLLAPAALWLLFLPNAPYMLTDLLHLAERPPVPLWYDSGMLVAFAWAGMLLGVTSLGAMQSVVRRTCGRTLSWLFVFCAAGLSGLGIYLGRFLNWNSWDVFIHPRYLLSDALLRLVHPFSNTQTYGVTLMFAAILLVFYLTFTWSGQRMSLDLER